MLDVPGEEKAPGQASHERYVFLFVVPTISHVVLVPDEGAVFSFHVGDALHIIAWAKCYLD